MMPAAGADCQGAAAPEGWTALGAPVQLVVTEAAELEAARAILTAELTTMDAVCGSRPGSELTELGSAAPGPVPVSSLLADAVAAALRTAALTGGDVDPTVRDGFGAGGLPGLEEFVRPAAGWEQVRLDRRARRLWVPPGLRLDLGATVTAWAADRCAGRLAGELGCGVLVGLGGNIAVAGKPPAGGWRIRIQDALSGFGAGGSGFGAGEPAVTVVALHDGGLATSSTAARQRQGGDALHYILDPRTGVPSAPFWRMVSVAAACCAFASAASTAAMIRGRHAKQWLSSLGLPARMVTLDGRVHTVAGWPACA
jgi:thiamine biosynthesis lipoprotein ApbE